MTENGDPGEIVRAGYDRVAERYRALEHDSARWPRASWLGRLTENLPPGAAVLDLATRQLVRAAGFGIEHTELGTQTEGGTDISYTWILARRPG